MDLKTSYLGLCKLEREILKKAKNAEKSHFLTKKISLVSVFSLFQNIIFQLAQP